MLGLYKVKCKHESYIDKSFSREEYNYIFAKSSNKAKKIITELEGFDEEDGRYYVVSCEFLRNVTEKELKEGVTEGVGGSSWDV